MVAYVHKEYSTYQFSEDSKGGMESTPPPPPPWTLRYRKKRGPERVKIPCTLSILVHSDFRETLKWRRDFMQLLQE